MRKRKTFYVYMLQCSTGELYTGYTVNPKRRVEAHNKGKGSRFTRSRTPVKLVYSEKHESRKEAMRRERQLKRKTRKEKMKLISKRPLHLLL